ncbi:MAG TPA: N-6 DNA methylase [Gemmatimonadaceae bacterium]
MQGLERALGLLRRSRSIEGANSILGELGFRGPSLPLDRKARATLGLPDSIRSAEIALGTDCLRGLVLELDDACELRQTLGFTAKALSTSAPQFLWIVCAFRRADDELAIACWTSSRSRVRVASLVCSPDKLYTSDAETLCALAAVVGESDLVTHSRWLDVLGREAITRRFFSALQSVVAELADSLSGRMSRAERDELALLYISRLIFLAFLEARGWLNGDFGFLSNGYSRCISEGGRYQQKVLEPLFFGTLNTAVRARSMRAKQFGRIPFLNGGLFARSHLEKQRRGSVFTDESFGNAFGSLLSHYRFSGREDSTDWSESSIDPEILGKTFEALMAAPDRKTSGAFYTPQDLVEDVTGHALASLPDSGAQIEVLRRIRLLDPACGSGAFLVQMLERIAALRKEHGEPGSVADIRRRVLASSIFGVDLNPMAVWLCELRLWLSIVIESDDVDPMRIAPLPNLDRHIRVGDSLAGGAFDDRDTLPSGSKIGSLRARYMRAVGPRKRTLARALDRLERSAAIDVLTRRGIRLSAERREMLIALRSRDLFGDRHAPETETRVRLAAIRYRLRENAQRAKALRAGAALPFSFAAHFSDVAATGGFDVIIGNPPWVRVHHIAETSRERLRRDFTVYRNAAWESGASSAGAGRGFAAQIDLAALFVERSFELLRPGGTLALLLPTKLWRSLAGGGVRHLLLDRTDVVALEDLADSNSQFDAAVYPSLLVVRRRMLGVVSQEKSGSPNRSDDSRHPVMAAVRTKQGTIRWTCPRDMLSFDRTTGSPWVLIPPLARRSFDRVARAGAPLFRSDFGRPLLGVKTGCNSAYIVRVESIDGDLACISGGSRTGLIERNVLRPLIRGETLEKWTVAGPREYLVWPHDEHDRPRRALPPLALRWLLPFHDTLSARSDLHGRFPWWSVFRTESASHAKPRVIWADFGLTPRATVVEAREPFIALNSCYVVSCETIGDAHSLATLLNSSLAAAWLNSIAEPARGGYRRYLGWTLSLLPIPVDWNRARNLLAPLAERAMHGDIPTDDEILGAVLGAYQLCLADVQPLLSWTTHCD